MKKLTVRCGDTALSLVGNNLKYEVIKNGVSWVSQGRSPHLVFQRKMFGKYLWFFKKFSAAKRIKHEVQGDSIVSTFSGFRVLGREISATFTAKAKLTSSGRVEFSLSADNEADNQLKAAYFPAPFNARRYDRLKSYTVDPMRQGFILPDTYKKNRFAIFLITKYWRKINTGDAYLAAWGRVCDGHGYTAVIDESYDAALFSCYGRKKALLTSVNWMGTLGKLGYERKAEFRFYDECSYVNVAKDFRNHEKEKQRLVTIDEKIKANPNVAKLIGTPVLHWRLMENNSVKSQIYKKTKVGKVVHNTFDDTVHWFEIFRKAGLERAYVHLDGWGNHGYDNLHPYILPPAKELGGYEGMLRLRNACSRLGYCFGLHDQYRDYYHDSPVYDKDKCVTDINGKAYYCDIWSGGPHNWLCSKFAKQFVSRTYSELEEHGIYADGTYLDVFGIMWGDECYHKGHEVTRKQSIELRGECFDMLRKKGMIVSSEEPGCQMVQYLDLLHHAPYAVTPQEGGKQVGIPVPLTNLVYHDCVFVPWHCEGRGGWGIPDSDSGWLHCILNGQTPYFSNSMAEYDDKEFGMRIEEHIKKVMAAADVNAKVYNSEMVSHEFLSDDYRVQKTVYANGTVIKVNFDENTFSVEDNNA